MWPEADEHGFLFLLRTLFLFHDVPCLQELELVEEDEDLPLDPTGL